MSDETFHRLSNNLERCRRRIRDAAAVCGRRPEDITLLPVTKYVDPEYVRLLYRAGLRNFAESRVQRGITLQEALSDLPDIRWHLIGHLQRNKTRRALQVFSSIHSVDSLRLANQLLLLAPSCEKRW